MSARTTLVACLCAATLAAIQTAAGGDMKEGELEVVSGVLLKLDLPNRRGLLTTDLGRPIYFDVPNAYLFENVTVGAHISLRLDEEGRAVKVMDTSLPDVIQGPEVQSVDQDKPVPR